MLIRETVLNNLCSVEGFADRVVVAAIHGVQLDVDIIVTAVGIAYVSINILVVVIESGVGLGGGRVGRGGGGGGLDVAEALGSRALHAIETLKLQIGTGYENQKINQLDMDIRGLRFNSTVFFNA